MNPMTISTTLLGTPLEARLLPGDEPRIEAETLGQLLGYDRPRKARELVKRMLAEGRMNANDVCPTVGQSLLPTIGRPPEQLWLSERAMLLVAAASETERAWQVRTALVDFFLTFRRGGGPHARDEGAVLAEVRALRAEVGELRQRRSPRTKASMQTELDFATPATAETRIAEIITRVLGKGSMTSREILERVGAEIYVAAGEDLDAQGLSYFLRRMRRAGKVAQRMGHNNVAKWSLAAH